MRWLTEPDDSYGGEDTDSSLSEIEESAAKFRHSSFINADNTMASTSGSQSNKPRKPKKKPRNPFTTVSKERQRRKRQKVRAEAKAAEKATLGLLQAPGASRVEQPNNAFFEDFGPYKDEVDKVNQAADYILAAAMGLEPQPKEIARELVGENDEVNDELEAPTEDSEFHGASPNVQLLKEAQKEQSSEPRADVELEIRELPSITELDLEGSRKPLDAMVDREPVLSQRTRLLENTINIQTPDDGRPLTLEEEQDHILGEADEILHGLTEDISSDALPEDEMPSGLEDDGQNETTIHISAVPMPLVTQEAMQTLEKVGSDSQPRSPADDPEGEPQNSLSVLLAESPPPMHEKPELLPQPHMALRDPEDEVQSGKKPLETEYHQGGNEEMPEVTRDTLSPVTKAEHKKNKEVVLVGPVVDHEAKKPVRRSSRRQSLRNPFKSLLVVLKIPKIKASPDEETDRIPGPVRIASGADGVEQAEPVENIDNMAQSTKRVSSPTFAAEEERRLPQRAIEESGGPNIPSFRETEPSLQPGAAAMLAEPDVPLQSVENGIPDDRKLNELPSVLAPLVHQDEQIETEVQGIFQDVLVEHTPARPSGTASGIYEKQSEKLSKADASVAIPEELASPMGPPAEPDVAAVEDVSAPEAKKQKEDNTEEELLLEHPVQVRSDMDTNPTTDAEKLGNDADEGGIAPLPELFFYIEDDPETEMPLKEIANAQVTDSNEHADSAYAITDAVSDVSPAARPSVPSAEPPVDRKWKKVWDEDFQDYQAMAIIGRARSMDIENLGPRQESPLRQAFSEPPAELGSYTSSAETSHDQALLTDSAGALPHDVEVESIAVKTPEPENNDTRLLKLAAQEERPDVDGPLLEHTMEVAVKSPAGSLAMETQTLGPDDDLEKAEKLVIIPTEPVPDSMVVSGGTEERPSSPVQKEHEIALIDEAGEPNEGQQFERAQSAGADSGTGVARLEIGMDEQQDLAAEMTFPIPSEVESHGVMPVVDEENEALALRAAVLPIEPTKEPATIEKSPQPSDAEDEHLQQVYTIRTTQEINTDIGVLIDSSQELAMLPGDEQPDDMGLVQLDSTTQAVDVVQSVSGPPALSVRVSQSPEPSSDPVLARQVPLEVRQSLSPTLPKPTGKERGHKLGEVLTPEDNRTSMPDEQSSSRPTHLHIRPRQLRESEIFNFDSTEAEAIDVDRVSVTIPHDLQKVSTSYITASPFMIAISNALV